MVSYPQGRFACVRKCRDLSVYKVKPREVRHPPRASTALEGATWPANRCWAPGACSLPSLLTQGTLTAPASSSRGRPPVTQRLDRLRLPGLLRPLSRARRSHSARRGCMRAFQSPCRKAGKKHCAGLASPAAGSHRGSVSTARLHRFFFGV